MSICARFCPPYPLIVMCGGAHQLTSTLAKSVVESLEHPATSTWHTGMWINAIYAACILFLIWLWFGVVLSSLVWFWVLFLAPAKLSSAKDKKAGIVWNMCSKNAILHSHVLAHRFLYPMIAWPCQWGKVLKKMKRKKTQGDPLINIVLSRFSHLQKGSHRQLFPRDRIVVIHGLLYHQPIGRPDSVMGGGLGYFYVFLGGFFRVKTRIPAKHGES